MKYSDAEVNIIVISVMIPMFVLIAFIYYFIMLPKSSRIITTNKFNRVVVTWNYCHMSSSSYDCNKVIPIRSSSIDGSSSVEKKDLTAVAATTTADINITPAAADAATAVVNYVREYSDVAS